MEYLDHSLCLEFSELVPAVMTKFSYDDFKRRDKITVHGIGGNGRKILIELESLPDKYRAKVREIYGDPYTFASKQPMLNSLEKDYKAEAYYQSYVLPTGELLPDQDVDLRGKPQINYVKRYTENVTWLNMLNRMTTDKLALKRELNISIMTFWDIACDLINVKGVNLPANPKRLKDKLKSFSVLRQAQGDEAAWESLIEKHKFGNSAAAKIADQLAEAFLKELIAHRNKHDDTVIAATYNAWAIENDRPEISPGTVAYRRKQWTKELTLEREGYDVFNNKYSKKIKRDRTSAPLLFINSDDNVWDVFFKSTTTTHYRPVLYVVIDTFNDYILGYAWGDTVTKELVKEAYRNAMRHVMKITGNSYVWQQIQTDRWGISNHRSVKKTELEEFYSSMATFTGQGLKNPNSKYVEQSFSTTWHQVLKLMYPRNYAGHNAEAREKLAKTLVPSQFPDESEISKEIERFIWAMRLTKRNGEELTRHEEWVQAFNASEKSKKKLWTPEQRLQILGVPHVSKNGKLNSITARGIDATINGVPVTYELTQEQIYEHVGKEVQLYYDPADLSEVMVTDGKGLRFIARTFENVPAAFADYEDGDAERIHQLQAEKKTLLPMVQSFISERKALLEREQIDAESRLLGGVMVKRIAQDDARVLSGGKPGEIPAFAGMTGGAKAQDDTLNGEITGGVAAGNGALKTAEKPLKAIKSEKTSIYDLM